MARISAVKRRNAWRRAIREVGVLFVAIGLGNFAFTIFRGKFEVLQALFLAIFLNVAGLLAINYSIETEEEETSEDTHELSLEDSPGPEEIESRDSMWGRVKGAREGAIAQLRRRRLATNIRNALVQLAHPGRNPRPRP